MLTSRADWFESSAESHVVNERILFQYRIYRQDLRANPNVLYLFGDNCLRVGLGGQAREMRGEPNAVGVRTKKAPGMAPEDFFTDDELALNRSMIKSDLVRAKAHLREGRLLVIPSEGLGTGLSDLPSRAPLTYEFLQQALVYYLGAPETLLGA